MTHNEILHFWFSELGPSDWYKKNTALDLTIKDRFLEVFWQATRGELSHWRATLKGRLAEIIVLDQFSRNMFRGDAMAFHYDSLAVILAQEASKHTDVMKLEPAWRAFLYMPLMHSESLIVHEQAVNLFSQPGLEHNLEFEIRHKVIIERFGRYPHRNQILGRESTPQEIEFLKGPNSSF